MTAGQTKYQVRFEWGADGAQAISEGVDAVVWVDQLGESHPQLPDALPVVGGSIQNSAAVASWVLDRQAEAGDRFTIAVIAAGGTREDGSFLFAVEDLLGAGAVVDALATVGIDYCSPEAAAACAAYISLRPAVAHLISASEGGVALGMPMLDLDPVDEVTVLR